jgi:hypothetical protein
MTPEEANKPPGAVFWTTFYIFRSPGELPGRAGWSKTWAGSLSEGALYILESHFYIPTTFAGRSGRLLYIKIDQVYISQGEKRGRSMLRP